MHPQICFYITFAFVNIRNNGVAEMYLEAHISNEPGLRLSHAIIDSPIL